MKEGQVNGTIMVGKILIRDGSRLPEALHLEREPCVAGWRVVTNFNGYELDRRSKRQDGPSSARAGT
jgi:hypothetical protein